MFEIASGFKPHPAGHMYHGADAHAAAPLAPLPRQLIQMVTKGSRHMPGSRI